MYDLLISHPLMGSAKGGFVCELSEILEVAESERQIRAKLGLLDYKVLITPVIFREGTIPPIDMGGF